VIELSHTIHHDMPTYPGLPRPVVDLYVDHARSRPTYDHRAEFAIGRIDLVGNTGTYLDSPYHRYPDGPDVSQLPLTRLVDLPTTVIDTRQAAREARQLDLDLTAAGPLTGRAVLLHTGWDRRWATDGYWEPGPFLGPTTVQQLLRHRPALVGVDFWNVDDPNDPTRPVHTALLGAGIPIVEHLNGLAMVPAGARSFFVPLAIAQAPSLPIRAFAIPATGTVKPWNAGKEVTRPPGGRDDGIGTRRPDHDPPRASTTAG
jgi:arylformamidase